MLKRAMTLCLVLGLANFAYADAVIDIGLSPSANAANGAGMYDPGEVVDFTVSFSQDTGADMQVRLMAIDFTDTSPEITLADPYFAWDFAGNGVTPGLSTEFNTPPHFNITYQSGAPIPGFLFVIPAAAPLQVGAGQLTLPVADGVYDLDVMNATDSNLNFTARLDYDFASPTTWTAFDGTITGGVARMTVVPEPVSLALLAIGGVAVLRRRRA